MHPNAWPHDRVDRLTTLWSSSLPAPEIATRLTREFPTAKPVSGDAVTKKAKSEGLPRRPRSESETSKVVRGGGFSALRAGDPQPPMVFKEDVFPVETRKTFLELNGADCRWPGASGFFCGTPAEPGLPYCGSHCARSYPLWRGLDDRAA